MKKQVLKIFSMLSLFVTLAAVSVSAQSDMSLKVNIPFEFSMGEKILPAGEYTVRYAAQSALAIRSVDRSIAQVFLTNATRSGKTPNKSSLVFHRYGNEYFLSKVWTAGNDAGYELIKSRAERELISARSKLAYSATERQTVTLVAHR